MKKLSFKGSRYLKFIHLIFAILWIGGVLALVVVLIFTTPTTQEGLYIRSRCVKLIDDIIVIPGGIGSLLTGIAYGVWSKWGFFKHRWITVKWILTIGLATLGGVALGKWVNDNVYSIEGINEYMATRTEFNRNVELTIFWGTFQLLSLLVVLWISILKPWKKK